MAERGTDLRLLHGLKLETKGGLRNVWPLETAIPKIFQFLGDKNDQLVLSADFKQ